MKDFYSILATDINSTSIEIKEAYENLLKNLQPYLNQNDSQFQEVCEAYEVLGDPDRRRQYDKELNEIQAARLSKIHQKQQRFFINRTIDVSFTLILILFTFIFGNYVIKSISSSKAIKTKKATVFTTVSFHKTKHHKKRHISKIRTIINPPKINSDTVKTPLVGQVPVTASKTTASSSNTNSDNDKANSYNDNSNNDKNSINTDKSTNADAPFLYATYIRSNETGVINMRKSDNYSSVIIKVIPTNSQVFVLEKGSMYYKILFDNSTGYVPKWTLQTK
ncbi:DnaJ domain-containing protein [Mucilaginibacter arboris]|uniref:DnaJ domain-containing protein n=1 Tax=Mucilaginibacter arboris TaxID=2682090 RepID=A0A7K1SVR7_9SPHI|nr:DnaJ domain-containing protein [Mucilaginibacter arboris]MVN21384.1 DnaJ domain-containing protein [Mucilaginibacter arboris]